MHFSYTPSFTISFVCAYSKVKYWEYTILAYRIPGYPLQTMPLNQLILLFPIVTPTTFRFYRFRGILIIYFCWPPKIEYVNKKTKIKKKKRNKSPSLTPNENTWETKHIYKFKTKATTPIQSNIQWEIIKGFYGKMSLEIEKQGEAIVKYFMAQKWPEIKADSHLKGLFNTC